MKNIFLRGWTRWRRLRRGTGQAERWQQAPRLEALMRRANPFAVWSERVNWIIDVLDWIQHEPRLSLVEAGAWNRVKQQRMRFMLDWLDGHRDVRKVVQATLQKTLREATGPELFTDTGLPRETGFFSEIMGKVSNWLLPKPPTQGDLSALFIGLFSQEEDFNWLRRLDHKTLVRLWRLMADEAIAHSYRKQIDEALIFLSTMVISVGISPAFRQRLDTNLPMQATPFMSLRRELEKYLVLAKPQDDAALRSVRMLIAVCQAQTDKVYAHLDEHGVSVGLVYHIERMRAQLSRMARLIDLRAAESDSSQGTAQVQTLLAELIASHHQRSAMQGLARRSFSLLSRKTLERTDKHGVLYAAPTGAAYQAVLKGAWAGGAIAVLTVLGRLALGQVGLARFFEGLAASLNYALSFVAIGIIGGIFAATQPAVTMPVLASRMGALDTVEGLRTLITEIASLLRAQTAAVLGNLMAVIPVMLVVATAMMMWAGVGLTDVDTAAADMRRLSLLGSAPLFAAITGVLLWLASMVAGVTDNWFALRRLRDAVVHHRGLVQTLGTSRAERIGYWLERNICGIAGGLTLALLFGMMPVLAEFFGLPLEIQHVTLAAGALAVYASALGPDVVQLHAFWWAVAGVLVTGVLNVGVAFACGLLVALHARAVPAAMQRMVVRSVIKRLLRAPFFFLLPRRQVATTARSMHETEVEDQEDAKAVESALNEVAAVARLNAEAATPEETPVKWGS